MILSFIINDPSRVADLQIAGIDRIMIDLEVKGKSTRQQGKNLFLSKHQINDIPAIRKVCNKQTLFVRINPINSNSKEEIDTVIKMGADMIMLPYFHTIEEVKTFIELTNGAVINSLLVETKEAADLLPKLVDLKAVHEIHIGFNDLSISLGYKCIFEPILNGTLEEYSKIINSKGIPWGFGGLARLTDTTLPIKPELIFYEQLRLKASRGWLGRSFRDALNKDNVEISLEEEILLIRSFIKDYPNVPKDLLEIKRVELLEQIRLMMNRGQ